MVTSSSDYGTSRPDADGQDVRATFSYPMYQQFVADNKTMTDLFACAPFGRVNVVVDGQADIADGVRSSTGNYYRVLGVRRASGPDDAARRRPAGRAAGRRHQPRYWRSRFASDPNVVGKSITDQQRPGHHRRRHLAGLHRRSAAGARSRRTSRCRSRSTRSSTRIPSDESALDAAHVLVAAGDGPPEARRHAGAGAGESRRCSSTTARAGLDAYLEVAVRARARSTVEQSQPHGESRSCGSIQAAAASTTSAARTARGRRS